MADLAALQTAFAAMLRGEPMAPGLLHPQADLQRRLALYRNNSVASACKALEGAYPVIRQLVGDEFFTALAREYRRAWPSHSGDLTGYGAAFAAFLAGFEHAQALPYLPPMARLEWALHRAHHAADPAPFDPAALAAVPPHAQAGLRLRLHPACALVSSDYPVARIWAVHQPDHTGPLAVDFTPGPHHALVHRPRLQAVAGVLDAPAHAFLAATLAGATLAASLEAALRTDLGFNLGEALRAWSGAGVIVGFRV